VPCGGEIGERQLKKLNTKPTSCEIGIITAFKVLVGVSEPFWSRAFLILFWWPAHQHRSFLNNQAREAHAPQGTEASGPIADAL